MEVAIQVFSREGEFKTRIAARSIRSREHARKLWPLVSPGTSPQLVTWVSPSFDKGKLRRRSHFRVLPTRHKRAPEAHFDDEEASRWRAVQESPEHRQAKELLAAELLRRLKAGVAMPWAFKDVDASDYPLKGDFLLGADHITTEHRLDTPFGTTFRLDIAVIGPPDQARPPVIGGVEIELGHVFEGRKALIGRSIGFPLISIDISKMSIDELSPEWARQVLTETTRSNEQRRRRTYIYLHELLYPLYAQVPVFLDNEQRHQFLVFADDKTLGKLAPALSRLAEKLDYRKGDVAVAMVNGKNEQSRKMLENAGRVVGHDWSEFNSQRFLRITLPRPKGPADLKAHRYHMTMARILLLRTDSLVGYKYRNGVDNNDQENNVWIASRWDAEDKKYNNYRVLPKRLAYPVNRVISVISSFNRPQLASFEKQGPVPSTG